MSDSKNSELDALVDDLMGGTADLPDHSPENDAEAEKSPAETGTPKNDNVIDDSVLTEEKTAKKEGAPEKKDSAPEENKQNSDDNFAALQEELANTKKRLHDTQKAMHEANTRKAELQKELDSLKQKRKKDEGGDNWFNDDDDSQVEKFREELEEVKKQSDDLKNQQLEYQQEMRRQQWLKEADELSKSKSDFTQLVYEKLEPLVNEETGDPMIRALYMQQEDRSPAGAYAFAKKLFGYQEKLNAPEKMDQPVEEHKEGAGKTSQSVGGKAGLDRMNSADFAEERKPRKNMIDEIFG
jgi:chromosome segregation ATPase